MTTGVDNFAGFASGLDSPAFKAYNVTPHDTNELPVYTRKLWVGGVGDVTAILAGDSSSVTFTAVPAGTLLEVRAKIVKNTGTSASLIVAMY